MSPIRRGYLELRGGVYLPTGGFTDRIKLGGGGGIGLGLMVAPRFWLMGDADVGFHNPKGVSTTDLNVYHFLGKIGYDLVRSEDSKWWVTLNAGAGGMTFDRKGALDKTYFAINAGLKIGYAFADRVAFVLSPQGDIAFADQAVLGEDTIWIWPLTAGFRFTF